MMKQHTFVISAYGDSPYLEACIRSLKRQTVKTEILLCTSTPSGYIYGLAEKYLIPVYSRSGRSGIREDWNFAYHMADSRLVTIAHQDDLYQKDYVKTLLEARERYPDMAVFTSDYVTVRDGKLYTEDRVRLIKKLLRLPLRIPGLNGFSWVKRSALLLGNPICCPACTYNKELLGEPLFTSGCRFALDWETMLKLAGRPGRFICVERPLLYYRVHGGAATKACIEDSSRLREERAMFRRLWPEPIARLLMHHYQRAYKAYE